MPKKVFLITGNRPQHFALIDVLVETKTLAGVILQRENSHNSKYPQTHQYFADMESAISLFFGNKYSHTAKVHTLVVDKFDINSESTVNFIKKINPNLVVSFDIENISHDTFKNFPCEQWIIIPSFSYNSQNINNDEVFHTIVKSGNGEQKIIFKTKPQIRQEETAHQINMRSLRIIINTIPTIINDYIEEKMI